MSIASGVEVQSVTHASVWLIVTTPQEEDEAEMDVWHPLYGYLPFLPKGKGKVIGGMVVYVDDLLTVGSLKVIKAVLVKIKSIWDTSAPEILGEHGCMKTTYLGVTSEIHGAMSRICICIRADIAIW